MAAAKLTLPASSMPDTTPPRNVVPSPASATTAVVATSIVSSRRRDLMNGAAALPPMVRMLAKPSDRPNHTSPASCARNQKNRWKNVNPTHARSRSIVFEASTTPSELSSTSSSWPGARDAITSRGSRLAITNATPKITAEYISVAVAPMVFCMMPAGTTATAPTRPEIRPSFELASTSSASLRTTVGTSALFEIAYVF